METNLYEYINRRYYEQEDDLLTLYKSQLFNLVICYLCRYLYIRQNALQFIFVIHYTFTDVLYQNAFFPKVFNLV